MNSNLKTIIFTLLITQLSICCSGQADKTIESDYTQILETGLKGKVKQSTYYVNPAMYGEIPTDTSAFIVKSKMTFDKLGNAIEVNKLFNIDAAGSIKTHKMWFSGKGRDVSIKVLSTFNNGKITVSNDKYIWSDKYTYSIISEQDSTHSNIIVLDKNYQLIRSLFKNNDVVQFTEEVKTIYEHDKIKKIINTVTEKSDDEVIVTYQIQVVQEYDNVGNPTLVYMYNEIDEKEIQQVIYKYYIYY